MPLREKEREVGTYTRQVFELRSSWVDRTYGGWVHGMGSRVYHQQSVCIRCEAHARDLLPASGLTRSSVSHARETQRSVLHMHRNRLVEYNSQSSLPLWDLHTEVLSAEGHWHCIRERAAGYGE